MGTVALAACLWLVAVELVGLEQTLAYVAPTLALLVVLALGRYPGERAISERLLRSRAGRRSPPAASVPRSRPRTALPRGGSLLAAGLAGRAPPLVAL